uniref:Chitin-binding type-2 domain-containing protein n=1 Tax=Glossina morsitans morsitans TaxID=37546 RepID=A0A1B0FEM1_GLOMM
MTSNPTVRPYDCRETIRAKRAKRPRAPEPIRFEPEPQQDLENDDSGSQEKDIPEIPTNFLSPSVREYLELGKSIPGRPGVDYPILSAIPYTNFYCDEQLYPGFFADMETRCQGWHYCDIDGRQASFLCPNGTQFSQAVFVCDWWFNVRCDLSPRLYAINARLYQRPKVNPTRPHRIITKELLDDIFN